LPPKIQEEQFNVIRSLKSAIFERKVFVRMAATAFKTYVAAQSSVATAHRDYLPAIMPPPFT